MIVRSCCEALFPCDDRVCVALLPSVAGWWIKLGMECLQPRASWLGAW
jgi:hypothetical protein